MKNRSNPTTWLPLGEGTYNYVSACSEPAVITEEKSASTFYWVRKDPKDGIGAILATAARAVKNFKCIHPDIPARLNEDGSWQMAYVAGTQPTDEEIAETLVDIYARTGCIILDGCNPTNFIKRADGKLVCLDVDMVYHRTDVIMLDFMKTFLTGKHKLRYNYPGYLKRMAREHDMEKTVFTLNVLLFLEHGRGNHAIPNPLTYDFVKDFDFDWSHVPISQEMTEENASPPPAPEPSSRAFATTTHDLFLKLHQQDMGCLRFFYKYFTQVKSAEAQTLAEIVRHAQQSRCTFGGNVRSAVLLQRMGWFNQDNDVVTGSGLEKALRATEDREYIRFSAPATPSTSPS